MAEVSVTRILTILAIILIGVPAVFGLVVYGTISPCEALKKEARRFIARAVAEQMQSPTQGPWQGLASMLGGALAGPIVDGYIDALGPLECVNGLIRVHGGLDPRTLGPKGMRR